MAELVATRTGVRQLRLEPVLQDECDQAPVRARSSDRVLKLQRVAGNHAVAGLLAPSLSLADLISAGARLLRAALQSGEGLNENDLTNELFWSEQPALRGQRLRPRTPEALRWLRIRNTIVRPLMRPKPGAAQASETAAAAKEAVPSGMRPVDQIAAESGATEAATTDTGSAERTSDRYFEQSGGRYEDTAGGKPRLWLYGSSGANVCNMTSLTMSLVSIAGESEVRVRMIGRLRAGGMHEGAKVKVGGNWVALAEALNDSEIVGNIKTIDLVTAVAIGATGDRKDVTKVETIVRVARETGLVTATAATGPIELSNPQVRARAAQLLASGTRVIAGTVHHFVYLLEIRDDGAVVHDPAGARVFPGKEGKPKFLHSGDVKKIAREFFVMDKGRQETALRRVSKNPRAAAIVNRLEEIKDLPKVERQKALNELAKQHGFVQTGVTNFYASSEFEANNLRLRVTLTASKK